MTNDIREKTRAVFFAAIMVLSVLAFSASFAGAAAAQNADNPTQGTEFTIQDDTVLTERLVDDATAARGTNRQAGSFDSSANLATNSGLLGVPFDFAPFDALDDTPNTLDQTHTLGSAYYEDGEEYQVTVDASQSADAGIAIDSLSATVTSGSVSDVSTDFSSAGIITISFTGDGNTAAFEVTPTLVADDVEAGIDVDDASQSVTHEVEITRVVDGDDDETIDSFNAKYRLVDTGVIGFGDDAGEQFLGTTSDISTAFDGANNNASNTGWDVWAGSTLSFQSTSGDETVVEIFQADKNSDGEWVLGDREQARGTSPGDTTSIDTASLSDPDGDYFVVFGENDTESDNVVYIDLRSLDLSTNVDDEVFVNEDLEVDVSASDVGQTPYNGDIQAWFIEAGDEPSAANTIHVEEDSLDGDGSTTVSVDPEDDLNGEGEYYAIVAHLESGNFVLTDTVTVGEEPDSQVTIESPVPPSEDPYVRGDIIPIELSFENTDVATLTFGDRSENADPGAGQNFEMNVTVRDVDGDGEALVYLNTFQIGDNRTGSDAEFNSSFGFAPGFNSDYDESNVDGINHGLQAGPDTALEAPDNYDNSSEGDVVDVYAPEHDIAGGSATGAVIAGGITYDLVVTTTDRPHKLAGSNPTDQSAVRIQNRDQLGDGDLESWNAPGSGSSEIDPETAADIAGFVEDEIVTPADGTLADNDFLIFQASAEGLEGVIYDQMLREETSDNDLSSRTMHELVDQEARGGDDIITDEFLASEDSELLGLTLEEVADVDPSGPNQEFEAPDEIEIGNDVAESVIVDSNSAGFRDYYIPIKLESGTEFDTVGGDTTELEVGTEFEGNFTFQPPQAEEQVDDVPVNARFSSGDERTNVSFEFVDDATSVDTSGEDQLVVPAENNVTISGTSNIAAGTQLLFTVRSVSGVDEPLFERFRATTQYEEDAPNSWEFEVPDQFNNEQLEDTEFRIGAQRNRDTGQLMRVDGEAREFPGAIAPETTVNSLVFNDQDVAEEAPQVVLIEEVNLSQSGVVAIEAGGDIIGQTDTLDADTTNENVAIVLNETLGEETNVEAVAYANVEQRRTFSEGDVRVNATLTPGEPTPANFDVSGLDPQNATVSEPGEDPAELTISATVTNTGETEATQDVRLEVGGNVVDTESLTLAGGQNEDVSFTVDTSALSDLDAGDYTHAIATDDDSAEGTLTIAQPATFEVSDLDPAEATVAPGDSLTVSATIENTGDLEGTQAVSFTLDGETVTSEDVTLGAGASDTVSFDVNAPEEAGTYTHGVASEDDEQTGTLTVEEEPDDDGDDGGDDSEDSDDGGPGFGIAAALIALLGAALLAYRRRLE